MRISDWSADVCSSDLLPRFPGNLISAAPSNGCIRTRRIMMLKTFIWACAAASLTISGAALAHDAAKPGDPQIAHIASTARQIDVDAGKQALANTTTPAGRAFPGERVTQPPAANDNTPHPAIRPRVTPDATPTNSTRT